MEVTAFPPPVNKTAAHNSSEKELLLSGLSPIKVVTLCSLYASCLLSFGKFL